MVAKTPRGAKPPAHVELSTARRVLLGSAIGLGVAAGLFALRGTDLVERVELPLVDVRTRAFAGGRAPDPRIVVVEVLEEDVAAVRRDLHKRWPWELDVNATIFRVMAEAGVRAAMIDVFQFDRGAGLDDVVGESVGDAIVQAERENEAAQAEEFAAAMKAVGSTVLAFELVDAPQYEVPARIAVATGRLTTPRSLVVPAEAPSRSGANLPVRRIAEGATRLAFANVPTDADGNVRRSWTTGRWGGRAVSSLPFATADLVEPQPARGLRQLMPDGSFLVSFRGPAHRTYPRVSPSRILSWEINRAKGAPLPEEARAALQGKIVVWGRNLSGDEDIVSSPISTRHHGPDFQAAALDDLLHGDGRVRASRSENGVVLLLASLAVSIAGMASRRRFVPGLAAGTAALAVIVFAATTFPAGTSSDVFTPVLGVGLAWSGALVARNLTEGRYNRWLEGTFGRYLAPEVIDALKKQPALLSLGGVRRNITVLFSDVAGFTSLSEHLPAEETVRLLNEYLTGHCEAVFAEGGVVDKFLGDGVMAFFGDPVPQTDHAVRACRAALAVQATLPGLEPMWKSFGLQSFVVRIGLMSGEALVGNMGSRQRFDYTCMGDTVNLASRLEGANKAFGTRILLGPDTYGFSKDVVLSKPLADVVVVGREQPVLVAELLGVRATAPPDLVAHVAAYEAARSAAMRGDLDLATRSLDEAERLRPGDGPTAWFRGIVAKMRAGDEPTPWSGRYVLSSK